MRSHWAVRKRLAGVWYLLILEAFGRAAPPQAVDKRRVRIIVVSRKERDHSNLWLACDKLILDNLTRLGWIVDDSPRWVEISIEGRTGKPSCEIEVEG